MKRVELLSPAGDYSCFLAAISSGADAVYLSGEKYGARAYAKNFSTEELISAIDYAHVFGRKVFLTVNTLVKDDELSMLYDYLLPLYRAGLDGVIVQDLGVISYIRSHFPDLPVHASTQLAITGAEGISMLEREGVVRTVLAREVSLSEIKYINNQSDMELECFVHGALCYSYSGKCLFSSLIGGRSGNRGRCAGSCRQPYNDKYLLSTKDICCLDIIPKLIDAGIASFKIEGRMKSPEYVAGVTSIYRKYIDLYYDNIGKLSSHEITDRFFKGADFDADYSNLVSLYTRGGNSSGYYFNHNGKDMISVDGASYLSDKGNLKESLNDKYVDSLLKKEISGRIFIYPGEKMLLSIEDCVFTEGSVAEASHNKPLDEETVKKQLNKTKDTEFTFKNLELDIADNAFVRVADINDLRRRALSEYREYLLESFRCSEQKMIMSCSDTTITDYYKTADYSTNDSQSSGFDVSCSNCNNDNIIIACDVLNKEQFDICASKQGVLRLYVPDRLLYSSEHIFDVCKNNNKQLYVKFPSVIRYGYLEKNKDKILSVLERADGVLADNYEVIEFINNLKNNGIVKRTLKITGDLHLYALNRAAASMYKKLDVDNITMPVELNKKELISRGIYGEELIAYGYMPMMVSAQCVNNTINLCTKKPETIRLTDRKGASFCAVNDCGTCINTIYNSVPLSLHTEGDFIRKICPSVIRLNFTTEDNRRTDTVADLYISLVGKWFDKSYADVIQYETANVFKDNSFTKGHILRGVL